MFATPVQLLYTRRIGVLRRGLGYETTKRWCCRPSHVPFTAPTSSPDVCRRMVGRHPAGADRTEPRRCRPRRRLAHVAAGRAGDQLSSLTLAPRHRRSSLARLDGQPPLPMPRAAIIRSSPRLSALSERGRRHPPVRRCSRERAPDHRSRWSPARAASTTLMSAGSMRDGGHRTAIGWRPPRPSPRRYGAGPRVVSPTAHHSAGDVGPGFAAALVKEGGKHWIGDVKAST